MVDAPHVLDHAIGAVACQVAGAVQAPRPTGAEWIGDETVRRQAGAIEIAAREQRPTDHKFARDPHRHRIEVGVQQVDGAPIKHPPDRHHRRQGFTPFHVGCAIKRGDGHRRLSRTISVEQPHRLQACFAPSIQPFRWHRFATNVQLAQAPVIARAPLGKIAHQLQPVGSGQVDHGNVVVKQLLVEGVAVPQLAATYHYSCTTAQGRVQLLDETVEIEGAKLQHTIMRRQCKQLTEHFHMPCQGSMVDTHTFGPAGRA